MLFSRFTKNEHYRKYFFNTGWLLAEKVLRILSGAILGILIARFLGPDKFGSYNYALSLIAIVIPIAGLGLGDILIRDFIRYPDKEDKLFATALYLRFFSSSILISVVILLEFLFEQDTSIQVLVYILSLSIFFQAFDIFDRYYQSKVKARLTVKANIIALGTSTVLKIVLILVKASVVLFAITYALEFVILAGGWIYFYYTAMDKKLPSGFSPKLAIRLVKESGVLVLSSIMIILYMRIDQIMIKEFLNTIEVGNFSAAVKMSEAFHFIPIVITNSLMPAIVNGKNMGQIEYRKRMQKLFDLLTWIAVPAAIVITIIATPLTGILFGPAYHNVDKVLTIHIWASVFTFWGVAYAKCIVIENMAYFVTFSTFLGSSLNIVLNLILIPRYGIIGAAVATLAAQACATFLSLAFFNGTRYIFVTIVRSLNIYRVTVSLYNSLMKK